MTSGISDNIPCDVIRFKPVFKQMVWGGSRMREEFGYEIPGDDTGECWAIAAHRHGDCEIDGGEYDGKTLSWLWKNKPELFGRPQGYEVNDDFPMLVKIIDARRDLSVQVHPDDKYALINENGAKGKMECWYILDCKPDATIIIGHNAKTHEELEDMIRNDRWNELLREIPIRKGDFFQIFPGTVHAIKAGTMILETQQNSDITYRLYDYGRLQNGHPRELHIDKSLDVIKVPYDPDEEFVKGESMACDKPGRTGSYQKDPDNESLVDCEFYHVWHLKCHEGDRYYGKNGGFILCSVTDGDGKITVFPRQQEKTSSYESGNGKTTPVRKGDHFMIPAGFGSFTTTGNLEMICSVPEEYGD